ncbi:anti-sigma factor [Kushneria konosiri]|uniref:Regulator of SigK n=1 Tax=Kushneria konosiri TaxID=698828 RepID=A0A2Z2H5D0_9GAMM|nr:anti-sigma factor [Kushneria konosiri]ARS51986.1 RNA polymerase subunit sigma-70 [Kushneria konosiri]
MNTPHESDLPSDEDKHVLAGEYVLGTLSHAERQAFEARLTRDPELRRMVIEWEERFFPYTALTDPQTPSDFLWPRIQRSLEARRSPAPATGLFQRLALWRTAAGLGVAATLVMAALLWRQPDAPATPEYMVVLLAPQSQSAGWVVQAANRRQIELIPLGTFEVPEGKALQFWTKADDWQAPVSLGLVQPGRPVRLNLDTLPPLEDNQLFELTLEDATGSPTGLPTGPIEYIGRAVEI